MTALLQTEGATFVCQAGQFFTWRTFTERTGASKIPNTKLESLYLGSFQNRQ